MRHYDTTFFCEAGKGPVVDKIKKDGAYYPFMIPITSSIYNEGSVVFHLKSESDLIRFKNSVIEAFNAMKRRK